MAERGSYRRGNPEQLWWCNIHKREATHVFTDLNGKENPHCDPKRGGIMLPCRAVNLTDDIELEWRPSAEFKDV